MPIALTPALRAACLALAASMAALACGSALAEKADRSKQLVIEADRPGTLDLQRQVVVFNGNVTITQGTMVIRADHIEVREATDGYRAATAIGTPAKQASYRQKREGLDETVEGTADRIEYDGRTDILKFIGNGSVRRLRAGTLADEITGNLIIWDATAEVFNVEGGATTPVNPNGRVRAVLSPREAASAAAAASAASGAALTPSRALGERR